MSKICFLGDEDIFATLPFPIMKEPAALEVLGNANSNIPPHKELKNPFTSALVA